MTTASPGPQSPITNVSEAEGAIANLNQIMNRLAAIVEEETERVRVGKPHDAVVFDNAKVELAHFYAAETGRVKAANDLIGRLLPEALDRLRQRHNAFHALLQANLTVLATAHAVSEGIIRGVSYELTRKHTPSTYGPTGRPNTASSKISQPMAVSRSL